MVNQNVADIDHSKWNKTALHFCLKRGLNEEDSKELIQDSWIIYLSGKENFAGRSKLTTYLYGILINKLNEHFRRSSLRRRHLQKASKALQSHSVTHPEQEYLGNELQKSLNKSLFNMSDTSRKVMTSTLVEDYSNDELTKQMGLSKNNFAVILHRAKQQLRADFSMAY